MPMIFHVPKMSANNFYHHIFDIYYCILIGDIFLKSKSMPVLSITANVLPNFHQYTINSSKLPLYNQSYDSLDSSLFFSGSF